MGKSTAASVLIVDDQEEGGALGAYLEQSKNVSAKLRQPEDVTLEDVTDADLVLVDYQLEKWPERDSCPVSRQPRDGLALAGVLRRHVHDRKEGSPTAIAILTGQLRHLAAPLQPEHREHVLARICNLEWVFQKAKAGAEVDVGDQIAALAVAVTKLPKQWPLSDADEAMRQLADILGIELDSTVGVQQSEDVAACTPPVHELSEWSHGLAIIRWLLHRILPYPCFLWDSYQLAARLRIDHAWFIGALERSAALRAWLDAASYRGLLAEFAGKRWWRSSIELLLWEGTKQQSFEKSRVWAVIAELTKEEVKSSSPQDHPIVCVNSDYRPLEKFAAMEDAVRIRPDDWPPFADQPWTTIELARSESRLGAIVISEDRGKLDASRE